MQKTATTPSKILDLTAAAFLLVAFLTGIAGALQTPTLSIFLADELKARPIMVGFFFTGSAITKEEIKRLCMVAITFSYYFFLLTFHKSSF